MKKIIVSILVIGCLLSTSIASVNAFDIDKESEKCAGPAIPIADIYVDDDNTEGPWDGSYEHPFQTITEGINASEDGDLVYVFNGIYTENVEVNKSITLKGQNKDNTIIDGCEYEYVVRLDADGVKITGFTIQNSSDPDAVGIYVISNSNIITGNIITNIEAGDDANGIWLYNSSNNLIKDNRITNIESNWEANGIYLWHGSSFNTIQGNIITDISGSGIPICGIYVSGFNSNSNIITDNIITDISGESATGMMVRDPSSTVVTGNTIINISGNSAKGMKVGGEYSTIANNTISDINGNVNAVGIVLDADHITAIGNIVKNISSGRWAEGIGDKSGDNTIITGNTITNIKAGGSIAYGIASVRAGDNATFTKNIITNIESDYITVGIWIEFGSNHIIADNTIENVEGSFLDILASGISLEFCYNTNLTGNIINKTRGGILIMGCVNGNISGNNISNTRFLAIGFGAGYGIHLYQTTFFNIMYNTFKDNYRDASFEFRHNLVEGEPYEPGTIPQSYIDIRDEKDLSNTWKGNYWDRPMYRPKVITGILEVFPLGWPYNEAYRVALYNYDYEPKTGDCQSQSVPLSNIPMDSDSQAAQVSQSQSQSSCQQSASSLSNN